MRQTHNELANDPAFVMCKKSLVQSFNDLGEKKKSKARAAISAPEPVGRLVMAHVNKMCTAMQPLQKEEHVKLVVEKVEVKVFAMAGSTITPNVEKGMVATIRISTEGSRSIVWTDIEKFATWAKIDGDKMMPAALKEAKELLRDLTKEKATEYVSSGGTLLSGTVGVSDALYLPRNSLFTEKVDFNDVIGVKCFCSADL
jgi:hypothetical protein